MSTTQKLFPQQTTLWARYAIRNSYQKAEHRVTNPKNIALRRTLLFPMPFLGLIRPRLRHEIGKHTRVLALKVQ